MSPSTDRAILLRLTAWLAATLLSMVLGVTAFAALAPHVENPHGKFKEDCQLCHNAKSWKLVRVSPKFDHSKYGFPLSGAHATSDCKACHTTLEFTQAKTACASCHEDPHRGEMGTECARCHGSRSFVDRGPMVRAHQQTAFPLTGSHATVDCEGCHHPAAQGQLQYKGTSLECRSCHMPLYQATRNPDHVAGGFPTDCQTCHTATVWTSASFNHDLTTFALTGAHRAAHCNQCHTTGDFKAARAACVSCHQADYDRAQPPHAAAGFGANACASCHTTTSFSGASFNHATTAFPLTGAHSGASCASCHGDGVYAGKSTACYSCHTSDYAGASPTHTAASFPPAACASCHVTSSWSAAFDHSATSFPLTGMHVSATCASCHGDGVYIGKSTACYSCHTTDYAGASPAHTAASFPPAACANCHNTTTFANATFDHNLTTFPLTGAHTGAACASCHGDGVYAGKSTACYSCHTSTYAGASPPHTPASFPTAACASCHNTSSWTTTFNHTATAFPLTGAHVTAACTSCHGDGVYAGKSTACLSCHTSDWNTPVVNHQAAAFNAAQCATCHNTTAWSGARYTAHDASYFRIYSGRHNGTWTACSTCHTSAADFSVHTCLSCHPHDSKTQTDSNHNGVSGYSYASPACYNCHRNV